MDSKAVKHLVVDSGAFIKYTVLQDLGECIYTVREVVGEIRDQATRDRLQVLPYELKFREPTPESVKIVTEFARKTGDLHVLSTTDIHLIALAYTLEKENVGVDHIRTQPSKKVEWLMPGLNVGNPGNEKLNSATGPMLPGFYVKKTASTCDTNSETNDIPEDTEVSVDDITDSMKDAKIETSCVKTSELPQPESPAVMTDVITTVASSASDSTTAVIRDLDTLCCKNDSGSKLPSSDQTESCCSERQADEGQDDEAIDSESVTSEEDAEDDDDSDNEGWITPGNIAAVKQATKALSQQQPRTSIEVACITTDYAMQNVLVQMGLRVVSVDGMLIRRTQSKVLRCYGCGKIMADGQREFCSHCGNKTLSRVTVSYNEDGTVQYFLSKNKKFSTRGLRYSLPTPRGGKHAHNPILCEDQRQPHKRPTKLAKKKVNVFADDYVPTSSPFAMIDVHSRAAVHGYTGHKPGGGGGARRGRNPNENNKHYGHRK